MVRLGLLVNPDAGLGGRLGLKGSDGQAVYARSQGAEDRSGPRVKDALEYFANLHRDTSEITWFTSQGRMGTDWIPKNVEIGKFITIHQSSGITTVSDTSELVISLIESNIDLLLYAGGDGTTRDIISVLESQGKSEIPVIGIPCGVKMHSGCFASSPKAGAEVLSAWLHGDLLISSTEVLDLDEDRYRNGEWVVRLYAEAKTPASPRWMQGAKMRVEATGEEEILEGLANHISELLITDSRLIIWGSGGTLRTIGEIVGLKPTLLGIDASMGDKQVGTDLNEEQLLNLLFSHNGNVTLLLSPMGGQGFLIGRGNLQLSPAVLREVGIENILGICTPAKLLTVRRLRIETGDNELDAKFAEKRYLKVLQGFRTTRVLPIAVD
ncbi:MAG: NAD(+)/NADH kinase [Candidatus Poseidoniales archaeon]|jgi:predicted polyphosphate/ATP-dependent NAD kinase|nr:NAD(+)/NADH kinase [Candidatus Poseidoniales archaeon]